MGTTAKGGTSTTKGLIWIRRFRISGTAEPRVFTTTIIILITSLVIIIIFAVVGHVVYKRFNPKSIESMINESATLEAPTRAPAPNIQSALSRPDVDKIVRLPGSNEPSHINKFEKPASSVSGSHADLKFLVQQPPDPNLVEHPSEPKESVISESEVTLWQKYRSDA